MKKVSEIIEITSFDGYKFKSKLTFPNKQVIDKMVIYVNGSGANTYDNKRSGFNYFDLFSNEFSNRGIAFLSYNTRGCDIGEKPPMYVDINYDEYKSYLPLNSVEDIYYIIKTINEKQGFENCKIYLLGWSEGTVIAPLVAEKYPSMVDGLLLAGYVNQNMKDVLVWQNNGGASMAWYRGNFKFDDKGRISKEDYEEDPYNVISNVLQNATFENLDADKDGYITEKDFESKYHLAVGYSLNDVLSAIERRNDEWLKTNYGGGLIPLTSGWFLQHFSLRSNMQVLPTLNLPIHIFHGTMDQNVDIREVYKIENKFKELNKNNLKIHIFDRNNHDLNFEEFIINKRIPQGIKTIFDTVDAL